MKGKRKAAGRWLWVFAAALLIAAVLLFVMVIKPADNGTKEDREIEILLDGKAPGKQRSINPESEDLRVYITLNGEAILDLPFEEAHTVHIIQPDGGENTLTMTGSSVYMMEANCDGQDCVQMGEVTRENLEVRVMGGFIICLPHRISVEVR